VNYWKVIVATVVIFGAGVFTGGLLVNYVHQTYIRAAAHHPPVVASTTNNVTTNVTSAGIRLPEVLSKPFLPKLDNLIHLSSDQHKAIEKIIAEAQAQMKKMIMDTQTNIRTQLTPEQRAQFDEVMKHPKRSSATNNVEKSSSSMGKSSALSTNSSVDVPTNPPATN
jgi:hypothetical protein